MTLTTGGPAPAGIYWQALIYTSVRLLAEPDIVASLTATAGLELVVTPTIKNQTPAYVTLFATPSIRVAPSTIESSTFTMAVTPSIGVGRVPTVVEKLSVTPSFSFTGQGIFDNGWGAIQKSIVVPNANNPTYPILQKFKQIRTTTKTPPRPAVIPDPGSGAKPSIVLPNQGSVVYPVLGALRQARQGGKISSPIPVILDSVGAGNFMNPSSSMSWTHNIGPSANLVVVGINWVSTSWAGQSVTIGARTFTYVGGSNYLASGGIFGEVDFYYLLNPPTGTQTITYSGTAGSAYSVGSSVSYYGVSTSAPVGTLLSSSNASITVSGTTNRQRIINLVGGTQTANGQDFSNYSQNQLYVQPNTTAEPFIIGDARGGAPVIFSATSTAADGYGMVALPINPA